MFIRALAIVFEAFTVLGAIGGAFFLFWSIMPNNSAIQTAATCVFAIGLAVIPYCIAGVFHRIAMRDIFLDRD